jgi:uridine kinase
LVQKPDMLIIGIAGGSGSGKSSVVKGILRQLPSEGVTVLPQDAYYKDQGHLSPEGRKQINFDHPTSIEFPLMVQHLRELMAGRSADMPVYSYVTCTRSKETIPVRPASVIVVEGILVFAYKPLRDLMNIKVFVDADADERLMRIIRRDINQRGRNFMEVLTHYSKYVKPMHQVFIEPTKRFADIIVPQGGSNHVAIDMIAGRIRQRLQEKS